MQRIQETGRLNASEERLRNLLLRGLAGDNPAYHAFLQELSAHLRAFLRKRLAGLPDEVEDLVQESLLAVHNQRHTYDAGQPLTAWIHAIAKYKLIDLLRRRAKRDLLTDPLDDEFGFASASGHRGRGRAPRSRQAAGAAARPAAPAHRPYEAGGSVGGGSRAAHRHVGIGGQGGRAPRPEGAGGNDQGRRMKTDDLVTMLATGAGAVRPNQAARRYAAAVGWGALGAALLMATLLGLRPDLAAAVLLPMFWVKLAFVACLAAAGLLAALRLSRPGARLAWVPGALAAPVLAMWLLAAVVLVASRRGTARRAVLRRYVEFVPVPDRPVVHAGICRSGVGDEGACADATAACRRGGGSAFRQRVGALVYCLHCPELEAPFIGFWYLLGMLIPTAAGAVLGPRLLRW